MRTILVVDDDYQMRMALGEALTNAGYEISEAEDGRAAVESVKGSVPDLVITDVKMPFINGIDLLGRIKREWCSLPVIVMTAYATVGHAVNAIKEGAFDYIQKPFDIETLYEVVKRALGLDSGRIACVSRAMKEVLQKAQQVAKSDTTVLVLGESGVGKELISRYIHEAGERREMPFVAVNCAAAGKPPRKRAFRLRKGGLHGCGREEAGKVRACRQGHHPARRGDRDGPEIAGQASQGAPGTGGRGHRLQIPEEGGRQGHRHDEQGHHQARGGREVPGGRSTTA
jgi:two-component system response regulator FlrC